MNQGRVPTQTPISLCDCCLCQGCSERVLAEGVGPRTDIRMKLSSLVAIMLWQVQEAVDTVPHSAESTFNLGMYDRNVESSM